MKRRNFLKSIIGAASIVAVPSLSLAKTKNEMTLLEMARASKPLEPYSYINVHPMPEYSFKKYGVTNIEQHKKEMEAAIVKMWIV